MKPKLYKLERNALKCVEKLNAKLDSSFIKFGVGKFAPFVLYYYVDYHYDDPQAILFFVRMALSDGTIRTVAS